jgi:protein-tyrosine phosphatase
MEANIGELFPQALAFFRRVEQKKAKVYVHCSAGISRAPTMVIAYLIAERKVSLRDAYAYVASRRPIIGINDHFLFQLAELEIAQGAGCSVTNHKDWMFYEFNRIRSDIEQTRSSKGLFFTALHLYRPKEDEDII